MSPSPNEVTAPDAARSVCFHIDVHGRGAGEFLRSP